MPEIKSHSYLIEYLYDIGIYSSNGMGISSISFVEIKAYCDLMKLNLTIWEVKTLKNMSSAYVSMHHDNYSDTTAPYSVKGHKFAFASDDKIRKSLGLI